MEGRRERQHYFFEEEEPEEPHNHQYPPFTYPPPLSSSSSSSSSTRCVPQHQMDSTDDHHASGSSGEPQRPVAAAFVEKEHMFEKVVTPSDVGKLNRLVIPKQHAEKFFPLNASANEKALLLSFEDCTGKQWRLRYSYWNSSQSYVMTKGWSRFVKEKRLDAGDTVSFGRGVGEAGRDRLFIDCKRRPDLLHGTVTCLPERFPLPGHAFNICHHQHDYPSSMLSFARAVQPWGGRLAVTPTSPAVSSVAVYDRHRLLNYGYHAAPASNPYWYLRSAGTPSVQLGGGGGRGVVVAGDGALGRPVVLDSMPVVATSAAAAKRVRLFGVNLDCSTSEDADSVGDSVLHGHPGRPPALPSLPLSLGVSEMMGSPRKDKQPMSLDLEM